MLRRLLGVGLAGLLAGCAADLGPVEETGELSAPLVPSCVADAECGAGYVCSPASLCVRPQSCVNGASGAGVLQGSLTIDAVDTAADMQALNGAWCVTGNVSIKKTALVDVTGLSGLVAIGGTLSIEDNTSLTSLHGFENLRKVFQLSMLRNASLESLTPLAQLKLLSSLQLYLHPKLTSLNGLQQVTTISWAEVVNNAGLTSLDGLGSIGSVYSYLDVRQNPLLTDVTGLNGVTSVGNLVQLTDNARLQSLNGLGNLTKTSTLRVLRNPQLTTLGALSKLSNAKTFSVADNPTLDSCNVTELATRVGADCAGCVRNGPCPPPDHCPDDPNKLEPGICGCGTADLDSDGDGAADCVDACPIDSANDSDLDGVCDSADACEGFDDYEDIDANGIPDGCQACVTATDCDDGNACTTDTCGVTTCSNSPALGQSCGVQGTCSAAGECLEPRCEIKPLGLLDPTSNRNSTAFAVSADGRSVTGRASTGPGQYTAFKWTEATGMVSLSYGSVSGRGISGDGSTIVGLGGSETNSNMWAFRKQSYLQSFPATTALWDVSENGLVAVGEKDGYAAYVASNSAYLFSFGRGWGSRANAVSADGSVIVGVSQVNTSFMEAFVRTASGMIGLGDFADNWYVRSEATDVSPDGQIVVGTAVIDAAGSSGGFRWTQSGGMVQLGRNFEPEAVTNSGMIVGNWSLAYVLGSSLGDGHVKQLLEGCGVDMSNWINLVAQDATPDGRTIVGEGVDRNYVRQAVLIRLP